MKMCSEPENARRRTTAASNARLGRIECTTLHRTTIGERRRSGGGGGRASSGSRSGKAGRKPRVRTVNQTRRAAEARYAAKQMRRGGQQPRRRDLARVAEEPATRSAPIGQRRAAERAGGRADIRRARESAEARDDRRAEERVDRRRRACAGGGLWHEGAEAGGHQRPRWAAGDSRGGRPGRRRGRENDQRQRSGGRRGWRAMAKTGNSSSAGIEARAG